MLRSQSYRSINNQPLSDPDEDPGNDVIIDLPDSAAWITAHSDQDYKRLLFSFLAVPDKLGTVVRWMGVGHNILYHSTSNGLFFEFLSENLAAAVIFTASCMVIAVGNTILEWLKQKKEREERQKIFTSTNAKLLKKPESGVLSSKQKNAERKGFEETLRENIDEMNRALQKVLEEDPAWAEQFDSFSIDMPEGGDIDQIFDQTKRPKMRFKFKNHAPKKGSRTSSRHSAVNTTLQGFDWIHYYVWERFFIGIIWEEILYPIWEGGQVASFLFWVAWILAGTITGVLSGNIFGISTYITLAMTVSGILPLLGMRIYNRVKYGSCDKAKLAHDAEVASDAILQKAEKRMLYDRDIAYLEQQASAFKVDLPKDTLPTTPSIIGSTSHKLRAVTSGTTEAVSQWISAQYFAWWAQALPLGVTLSAANPFVGGALILVGVGFGVLKMVKQYQNSNKQEGIVLPNGTIVFTIQEAEADYAEKCERLVVLRRAASSSNNPTWEHLNTLNVPAKATPSTTEKVATLGDRFRNNTWIDAWDWSMTGIFFSRLLLTPAAVFAPFSFIVIVNPYALLAALLVIGFVYVGMKWYEKRELRKEQKAHEMTEKIKEIDKQIDLMEKASLIDAKRFNANLTDYSRPSREGSVSPHEERKEEEYQLRQNLATRSRKGSVELTTLSSGEKIPDGTTELEDKAAMVQKDPIKVVDIVPAAAIVAPVERHVFETEKAVSSEQDLSKVVSFPVPSPVFADPIPRISENREMSEEKVTQKDQPMDSSCVFFQAKLALAHCLMEGFVNLGLDKVSESPTKDHYADHSNLFWNEGSEPTLLEKAENNRSAIRMVC